MNTTTPAPVAPRIEPVLRLLRRRIRRMLATRGALITVVTALAGLLVIAALDTACAPMPAVIRWLSPMIWLASVTAVAISVWWLPLRQPLDLIRIARWLETRHPELDESISTVLECADHPTYGGSSQLLDALAKEAVGSLGQINPQLEVSNRRVRRWSWPAAALLLAWGALFVFWPDLTIRHVVRALIPNSTLGNAAGNITVTPGTVDLIAGDTLQITARQTSATRQPLEIVLHLATGPAVVMPMEPHAAGAIYRMGSVEHNFTYEVRAGRQISDRFQVTVWPRPQLTQPRVHLEFPAYTGWPARDHDLASGITAITGTTAVLRAKLNTPVATARLEIDTQTTGATTLEQAADGGLLATSWLLDKAGHRNGRIILKHRIGREFTATSFTLETRQDAPPKVQWLGPNQPELHLRPDDMLDKSYQTSDDVGLSAMQLEVQPEQGAATSLPVDLPPRSGSTDAPAWRGHIQQAIATLASRWPQVSTFKLRLRAEDNRPATLGGPGVGTSDWLTVRLDNNAPSLTRQNLAAAHADALTTIDQTSKLVQQAQEKIDKRRADLAAEKIPDDARKELGQARDQLTAAHDQLKDLAARMTESVYTAQTPAVKQAASTIEQARQQLENAPLQDSPQARDQSAATAHDTTAQAERQLAKLRADIQRRDPQLQEYAQLKELEQQQRELARQADQKLAPNPPGLTPQSPPTTAWQQQQQSLAETIRQKVQKPTTTQAANLAHQAEQTQQLATAARLQAATQEALANQADKSDKSTPPSNTSSQAAQPTAPSNKSAPAAAQAAQQVAQLAASIRQLPPVSAAANPVQPAAQAAQAAQVAADQAQQATKASANDQPEAAATNHTQAAQQLNQAAQQLSQAAVGLAEQAAQAAQAAQAEQAAQAASPNSQAASPGSQTATPAAQALAAAYQHAASAASSSNQATAARQAAAAAQALAQAAASTLGAKPGQSNKSSAPGAPPAAGQPSTPGQPGTQAADDPPGTPTSAGVPPELAKLGISAADWEQIKTALGSEAGGASSIALPEEYRDLVRRYFAEITKESNK